jgi:hypothetical protein
MGTRKLEQILSIGISSYAYTTYRGKGSVTALEVLVCPATSFDIYQKIINVRDIRPHWFSSWGELLKEPTVVLI